MKIKAVEYDGGGSLMITGYVTLLVGATGAMCFYLWHQPLVQTMETGYPLILFVGQVNLITFMLAAISLISRIGNLILYGGSVIRVTLASGEVVVLKNVELAEMIEQRNRDAVKIESAG